jgi:hypothetical protein
MLVPSRAGSANARQRNGLTAAESPTSLGAGANERKEAVMNTTRHERNTQRLIGRASRLISLVGVALTVFLNLPAAMAATAPVEQILHITRLSPAPNDLALIESRLIFPAGARWEIDPDAGPLTLAVESGKVGIVLGGGLARIERQQTPLQAAQFQRLDPGRTATLLPGNKLVVVRGYQLRVDNDDDAIAAITVSRLGRAPDSAAIADMPLGKPR